MNAPRPAATVIVVRPEGPAPGAPLCVYLVKRHGRSGFMAGAHVFPGGRVDESDAGLFRGLGDEGRARARALLPGVAEEQALAFAGAAIRETAEECGLLLAKTAQGAPASAEVAHDVFHALKAGAAFGALLDERNLLPDVEALASFSWWVTPEAEPKRYDTRFFLAAAPAGQLAGIDEHEVTEGDWMTAESALARYRAKEILLAPPTLATLEDLVGATSLESAAAAGSGPGARIEPQLVPEPELVLALPGDPLHPVAEPVWPERRSRIVMDAEGCFVTRWEAR